MSDSSRFIPEHRRQAHKGRNQFRGDELRRRREDQQVEIRKQKKEENLAKRRNLETKFQEWEGPSGDTSGSEDENGVANRKVGPLTQPSAYRRFLKSFHRCVPACFPMIANNNSSLLQSFEKSCPRSETRPSNASSNAALFLVLLNFSVLHITLFK